MSLSNEQLLLIDILNRMYNDNLNQINNLTASNDEIRNLIVRLLNININSNNSNNYANSRGRTNRPSRSSYSSRNNANINTNTIASASRTAPIIFEYIFDLQNIDEEYQNQNTNTNTNTNTNAFTRLLQRFLEPVEIYPTQSQIESAVRSVTYGDIVSPLNRSCPISLENFNDEEIVSVIRHCGHTFKRDELNRWFRTNYRCPVCRYDIRNYNANGTDNIYTSTSSASASTSSASTSSASTTPTNNAHPETSMQRENDIQTLLTSSAEGLLQYLFDPSGNMNTEIDSIHGLLNNYNNNYRYQRRR
jgi:hypothetical protein